MRDEYSPSVAKNDVKPVMNTVNLLVRCMVRRDGPVWVAVCIDLCLAAQGDTRDAAARALHEQIALYVRDAVTLDAAHADTLLRRKAPVAERVRYVFWRAIQRRPRVRSTLARMARRLGWTPGRTDAYSEPLPLQPA